MAKRGSKRRGSKYEACKVGAPHHGGRPFTCRACGRKACWECALRYWPQRSLPQSATSGLLAHRAAVDEAEQKGLLLGVCSTACRAKLPQSFAADFRLPLAKNGGGLPRTTAIFDRLFDAMEAAGFDDFGTIELHHDEVAGADSGHGSERQFGYCSTKPPWRIAFAEKIEKLPDTYIEGLVSHEMGHALDFRYGRKALEKRFGCRLPDSAERRADKIAEYTFGRPVQYGALDIQCIGCGGKQKRPKRLG